MVNGRMRMWLSPLLALLFVLSPLYFPVHQVLAHDHESAHCHDGGHEDHDEVPATDDGNPRIGRVADLHPSIHNCSLCVTSLRFSNERALVPQVDVMGTFDRSPWLASAPHPAASILAVSSPGRAPPSPI